MEAGRGKRPATARPANLHPTLTAVAFPPRPQGRFSFVGARPSLELLATRDAVTLLDHAAGTREVRVDPDPLGVAQALASTWRPSPTPGLPDVFTGGFVGYCGYDTVRYVYAGKLPFASAPPDTDGLPDMHLALYDEVVVFDNATKLAYCVAWVRTDGVGGGGGGGSPSATPPTPPDLRALYAAGRARLDAMVARLDAASASGGGGAAGLAPARVTLDPAHRPVPPSASNMSKDEFLGAVAATKEHIQVRREEWCMEGGGGLGQANWALGPCPATHNAPALAPPYT